MGGDNDYVKELMVWKLVAEWNVSFAHNYLEALERADECDVCASPYPKDQSRHYNSKASCTIATAVTVCLLHILLLSNRMNNKVFPCS